jgi:hypothetical protein
MSTFAENIRHMEVLQIEILNPKATKLLKVLADLKLITIKPKPSFKELLEKFRDNPEQAPTFNEITEEVELVRQARYAKKAQDRS